MAFAHKVLLEDLKKKGKIKIEDLSPELQKVIQNFDKRESVEQSEETPEDTITALEADSWLIAQRIFDYHVDTDEQEVTLTPGEGMEQVHQAANEIIDEIKEEDKPEEVTPPAVATEEATPTEQQVSSVAEQPVATEQVLPAPVIDPVEEAIAAGAEPAPEVTAEVKTETPVEQDSFIPSSKDEGALHKLFKAGKTESISKSELSAAGLDTGFFGSLQSTGGKFGKYRLVSDGKGGYNLK